MIAKVTVSTNVSDDEFNAVVKRMQDVVQPGACFHGSEITVGHAAYTSVEAGGVDGKNLFLMVCAAMSHPIESNDQDFDALVAKFDCGGEEAAMKNVALAQSDLENLLTKHGTFCFADLLLLDLSIRSESLEFVQSCISETVFMTPVVLAQVVDALTCAAEIVQDEIGYTGPIKAKDLAEIEAAIHAVAWAFHELFKDPA